MYKEVNCFVVSSNSWTFDELVCALAEEVGQNALLIARAYGAI